MSNDIKIRVDDFLVGDFSKPKATHKQAAKALSYFEENNIKYYLACVLDYTTEDDIKFIQKELPNAVPLYHGNQHNFDRWNLPKNSIGWRNDFQGRSLPYLQTKIKEFKDRFSYSNIMGIVAPFNSFSQDILDIIVQHNFSIACTGPETKNLPSQKNLNFHNLKVYHSEGIYYSFKETVASTIHRIDTMPENYLMCYHLLEIKC